MPPDRKLWWLVSHPSEGNERDGYLSARRWPRGRTGERPTTSRGRACNGGPPAAAAAAPWTWTMLSAPLSCDRALRCRPWFLLYGASTWDRSLGILLMEKIFSWSSLRCADCVTACCIVKKSRHTDPASLRHVLTLNEWPRRVRMHRPGHLPEGLTTRRQAAVLLFFGYKAFRVSSLLLKKKKSITYCNADICKIITSLSVKKKTGGTTLSKINKTITKNNKNNVGGTNGKTSRAVYNSRERTFCRPEQIFLNIRSQDLPPTLPTLRDRSAILPIAQSLPLSLLARVSVPGTRPAKGPGGRFRK